MKIHAEMRNYFLKYENHFTFNYNRFNILDDRCGFELSPCSWLSLIDFSQKFTVDNSILRCFQGRTFFIIVSSNKSPLFVQAGIIIESSQIKRLGIKAYNSRATINIATIRSILEGTLLFTMHHWYSCNYMSSEHS